MLANHLTLSKKLCPFTQIKKEKITFVPYSSKIESLMSVMVCTRPDIVILLVYLVGFFIILVRIIRKQ